MTGHRELKDMRSVFYIKVLYDLRGIPSRSATLYGHCVTVSNNNLTAL